MFTGPYEARNVFRKKNSASMFASEHVCCACDHTAGAFDTDVAEVTHGIGFAHTIGPNVHEH